MPDALDLTGDIAQAIDGSTLRGAPVVVGYNGADGYPVLSFRGSTQVYGPGQVAFWARHANGGLVKEIAARPEVSLLYFSSDGPGPPLVSLRGRARVDPTANDAVYANMVEHERESDPDRGGVAVVVDVDSVQGFGANGPFEMSRDAGIAGG